MKEQSEFYIDERGNKFWYLPSKGKRHFHRVDGPACEYGDGSKQWFIDEKRHRIDGPAVEYADGLKHWYVDGKRHRLDGPACEWANGTKEWYVDGNQRNTEEIEEWLEENKIDLKTETGQMAFKLRWI